MLCCVQVYVISRNRNKEELAKKMGSKGIIPSTDEEEMKKFAGALC
jgi:D-arabinose 1-dehydrogenase-like Zn-dependent alcohol dehydrogenase